MTYFDDAKHLIEFCEPILDKIKQQYDDSLNEKTVKISLLIEIKNFMENLRSALDFTAHGLYEKYGDPARKANVYFPYAWENLDRSNFISRNLIDQKIPGLFLNRPDIASKIESYQHFSNTTNLWLPKFMDLNNENKHQKLTPQIRKEIKQLNISSNGAKISLGEGTSISLGIGASIKIGDVVISGSQRIDVNNPAKLYGLGNQEITTWVSFHFSTNNEAVLPLLSNAYDGIKIIVTELSSM